MPIVPGARARYLAEIADTVRGYKQRARGAGRAGARGASSCAQRARDAAAAGKPRAAAARPRRLASTLARREREARLDADAQASCSRMWPAMQQAYAGDEYVVKIRDKEIRTALIAHHAVGQQDPQGRAADATKTTASC